MSAEGNSNANGHDHSNPNAKKLSANDDSLYKVLGLEKGASAEEIKRAYRKMALQYHPDKNPDPSATEKIKELNRANHVLGDEKRKAIYDKYGTLGLQIASQFGEDNVATYFLLDNVCCKILLVACFVLTGCCCCCCCCFCCGKCISEESEEANQFAYDRPDAGAEEPVTSQPQSASASATEHTQLTSDQHAKYQYSGTDN